jgi:hypothetical protein
MFERRKVRVLNNKIQLQEAEIAYEQMKAIVPIAEGNDYVLPEVDEANWKLLGSSDPKGLDKDDQDTLREQAVKTYYKNGHGRNIIRLFEKYVAGHGFGITPMSLVPAVSEVWKEFWKVNKMDLKKKEIVRRAMRDGECFNRFFPGENKEDVMKIRFMNPGLVFDPDDKRESTYKGKINQGIETDPDDIETVLAYYYKGKAVPAEEVQHIKILVDSDVVRGRSFYEPILSDLASYKKWQTDRIKLNEIRNTVALIKKVKGNPTQAANIKTKYDTTRKFAKDNTPMQKVPKNISIYTTNKNVEYELKSPNLQAADVQKDGRAWLLSIAAGCGLPEFMISSDASNGSYASTMIAEGPAIMEFEDWQDFFAVAFKEIFYRVIEDGIEKGTIPKNEKVTVKRLNKNGELEDIEEDMPISTDCSITFPDLVSRDILDETKAIIMQIQADLMSKPTAQSKLDLDHEEEKKLMDKTAEEEGDDEDFEKDEEDLEIEKQKKEMEDEE